MSIAQLPFPFLSLHAELPPGFVDWLVRKLQPLAPSARAAIDAYAWRCPHKHVEVDDGTSMVHYCDGRVAYMSDACASWVYTLEELVRAREVDAQLRADMPLELCRMQAAVHAVLRAVDDTASAQPGPDVAVTAMSFAPPQWVTSSEDSAGNVVLVSPHLLFVVGMRVGVFGLGAVDPTGTSPLGGAW